MAVMLLTGCASGIGQHMAGVLAGHRLMLTDLNAETLPPDSENTRSRPLDVRDPTAWEAVISETVSHFGRLDVLMNIAGVIQPAYIADTTPAQIDLHVDVNIKGVMYGTWAVLGQMQKQGSGHIINMASLAALAPIPGIGVYSASKFAVRAFSLAAAVELRDKGISVSVVCPDAVQTPMLDLQRAYPEAVLTFSAPRILTVHDVEKALLLALEKRPLEITLPRYRGWLGKLAGALPGLALRLAPIFTRIGRGKQTRLQT